MHRSDGSAIEVHYRLRRSGGPISDAVMQLEASRGGISEGSLSFAAGELEVGSYELTFETGDSSSKLSFTVAYDPKGITMGRFGVKAMPTAFLVDRKGVVREKLIGARKSKLDAFQDHARTLLSAAD